MAICLDRYSYAKLLYTKKLINSIIGLKKKSCPKDGNMKRKKQYIRIRNELETRSAIAKYFNGFLACMLNIIFLANLAKPIDISVHISIVVH
jgi:hypothetical protein